MHFCVRHYLSNVTDCDLFLFIRELAFLSPLYKRNRKKGKKKTKVKRGQITFPKSQSLVTKWKFELRFV